MPFLAVTDKNGAFGRRPRYSSCLPSGRKNADEQTQSEGNAYGFIWMLTDATIGRLGGSHRPLFEPLCCILRRIECRR